jgi:3-oxoacyl-[acyl-carrier-protein] synthase III
MSIRSVIAGCGAYLPQTILTNADLEKRVDTTDEWIVQRTGIRQRHISRDDEPSSMMAAMAAREAMKQGGFINSDIDGVIVATSTPDTTFPSVAIRVQAALELPAGPAMDVNAACSGFIYALTVADNMITTGQCKRMLVIGAEKMSSILDWKDRTTCVLFGDGAGAVILEADAGAKGKSTDRGILSTHLYGDGRLKDILYTTGGTSTTGDAGFIVMEGREVFRHAVQFMADIVAEVLTRNQIKAEQIDWLVPHQANIRIIEATARKLDMSMDRVVVTVDHHGNTSAASIPLALCEAVKDGRVKKGSLILLEALGAGLTWGAALVRF